MTKPRLPGRGFVFGAGAAGWPPALDALLRAIRGPGKAGIGMSSALGVQAPPEWGIEPVPEAVRKLGAFDFLVLWGSLGVGLLVMEAGALLVPLSLDRAVVAIVIGSAIGVVMLAAAGRIGAIEGVPTMVLLRPVLGLRGSYIPSVLNVVQLVGWTAFELWIMGAAASAISERLLGHGGPIVWIAVFGAFSVLLALGGPLAVVRQWLEKFGIWAMLAASVYLTLRLVQGLDLAQLRSATGDSGTAIWPYIDLVIAMPVSWLPLVADYNRFARTPGGSVRGTFTGYLLANVWFFLLGLVFVKSAPPGAYGGDTTAMIVAVLTLAGGALALILILLDETDNVFADIYSAAVSLQNVYPALRQRGLVLVVGVVGVLLAATVQMADYLTFLYAIGSVFVPLFALLLADYHVVRRGARYETEALYTPFGQYWYGHGVRWVALVAWLGGVVAYHALAHAPALAERASALAWLGPAAALGSSVPAFAVTFLLYPVLVWLVARAS